MEIALKFIQSKGLNSIAEADKENAIKLYSECRKKLELYWEEPLKETHSGFDRYRFERIAGGEIEWDATCEFERIEKIIAPFRDRCIKKNPNKNKLSKEKCKEEANLIRQRLYMGYFLFQEDVYKVNHRIGKETGKRLSKYERESREARTALENCVKIKIVCTGGEIKQCSIHRKNRSKVIIDELYLGLLAIAIKESSISSQITISEGEISYTPSNTTMWEPLKSIINELLKKYSIRGRKNNCVKQDFR